MALLTWFITKTWQQQKDTTKGEFIEKIQQNVFCSFQIAADCTTQFIKLINNRRQRNVSYSFWYWNFSNIFVIFLILVKMLCKWFDLTCLWLIFRHYICRIISAKFDISVLMIRFYICSYYLKKYLDIVVAKKV